MGISGGKQIGGVTFEGYLQITPSKDSAIKSAK